MHRGAVMLLVLSSCQPAVVRRGTGLLPDPSLTPGATMPGVTALDLCTPGYAARARHVTAGARRRAFQRYGLAPSPAYVIDHLIPLELGGSNTAANLWPQPVALAARKDRAEAAGHRLLCHGQRSLTDLQAQFARDWTALEPHP